MTSAPTLSSGHVRVGLVFVGLVLGSLVVGGCNAAGPSAPSAATSTTVFITTPSAQHEFNAAQRYWVNGSIEPSFQQSAYFRKAAVLLAGALRRGVSNVVQYNMSVGELKQLAALPETNDTSVQKSQARHDIRALDRFFATAGLYQ